MPTSDRKILASVKRFYGSSLVVQLDDGSEQAAETNSRNKSLVCGDQVLMEERAGGFYVVETEPRRTEFFRTDGFGRRKVIAANIDQIVLVISPLPTPHMQVVDRYWVAARNCSIPMILLVNKSDLDRVEIISEIQTLYTKLGLKVLFSSTKTEDGVESLRSALASKASVFVGPSGVGKSSLVNSLCSFGNAQTAELSERREEGRHTTTTSDFYDIGNDARIIDSPGIREFGLEHYDQPSLESGFVEVLDAAAGCRFRDCIHQNTPGCAVEEAMQSGKIDSRRLQSYRQLLNQVS